MLILAEGRLSTLSGHRRAAASEESIADGYFFGPVAVQPKADHGRSAGPGTPWVIACGEERIQTEANRRPSLGAGRRTQR